MTEAGLSPLHVFLKRSLYLSVAVILVLASATLFFSQAQLEGASEETGIIELSHALILLVSACVFFGKSWRWSALGGAVGFQGGVMLILSFRELDLREFHQVPELLVWLSGDLGSSVIIAPIMLAVLINLGAHFKGIGEAWRTVPWKTFGIMMALLLPAYIVSNLFEKGLVTFAHLDLFFEEGAETIIAVVLFAYAWTTAPLFAEKPAKAIPAEGQPADR